MRTSSYSPFVGVKQTNDELPKAKSVHWVRALYQASGPSGSYAQGFFPPHLVRDEGFLRGRRVELRKVAGNWPKQATFCVVGSSPIVYLRLRTSAAGHNFFSEVPGPKQDRMTVKQVYTSTASGVEQLARVSLRTAAWFLRQAARPFAISMYLPVFLLLNVCLRLDLTRAATRLKVMERSLCSFISEPLRIRAGRSVDVDDEYVATELVEEEAQSARAQFEKMMREGEQFANYFAGAGARRTDERARTNAGRTTPDGLQGPHAPLLAETRKISVLMAQIAEAKKSGVANAISVVGQHTSAKAGNGALVLSLTDRVLELQKLVQEGDEVPHQQMLAKKAVVNQFIRLLFALPANSADFATAAKKSYRRLALAISSDKLRLEAGPKLTAAQKRYVDDLLRLLNLASELLETA